MNDFEAYTARRDELLDRLRQVLVESLQVDCDPADIDPDTPMFGTGLGFDSVDAVEIMVALEGLFHVTVPDDPRIRAAMRTLNTLIDFILANRHLFDPTVRAPGRPDDATQETPGPPEENMSGDHAARRVFAQPSEESDAG